MAKVRLTQADKKSLLDIIEQFIKDNTENCNCNAFIAQRKEQVNKNIQKFLDNAFDMTDDVKNFIKKHKLNEDFVRSSCGFQYFIGNKEYHDNIYFTGKFPNFLLYSVPDHLPEEYINEEDNKQNNPRATDIIYWFLRKYNKEIEKDLQEICKNYNDIYTKFKNIIYSLKYLEDVVQYFDIDAVKTFVNQRLAQSCSTTALISKDDIDFVDNFIKNTKKD